MGERIIGYTFACFSLPTYYVVNGVSRFRHFLHLSVTLSVHSRGHLAEVEFGASHCRYTFCTWIQTNNIPG